MPKGRTMKGRKSGGRKSGKGKGLVGSFFDSFKSVSIGGPKNIFPTGRAVKGRAKGSVPYVQKRDNKPLVVKPQKKGGK